MKLGQTHLLDVITWSTLPNEVQQAVLAILKEDRALGGIWVDKIGASASECASRFEC